MELTPIRIPGKRRRKGEPPLLPIVSHAVAAAARKDKKGNRIRRDEEKAKRKRPKTAKVRASYLEKQLPLEIMERIFWMSENVNFARAGPRLGHLLSGESTRRETFLQAFGPTWDVWFGCFRDGTSRILSYSGWQQDTARFGGNPEFQSALLQYSWADVSFIVDCMDFWVQRYAPHRFFQHKKLWGDPDTPTHTLDDDHSGGFRNFKSARIYFEHDYDAFLSSLSDPLPAPRAVDGAHRPSWIEVHCDAQIPEKLLTGPWDEAATQKLFWLVRAGARLSEDQTWETTLEGYRNALGPGVGREEEGGINLAVIRLLLILSGCHWPQYIADAEIEKLQDTEEVLRRKGERAAYRKYACVASMLMQRYSTLEAEAAT